MRLKLRIARIDAFGRKREQKILVELKALFLKHRLQDLVGRARIGRRFEDDQLPATHVFLDLAAGGQDIGHVRIFCLSERRRDADDYHVAFGQLAKIGRRRQLPAIDTFFDVIACNVNDIRAAGVDLAGFCLIDLKADRVKALQAKFDNQRQADITEADDADASACLSEISFSNSSFIIIIR